MPASSAFAVIILNWRRPQNIGRIVRIASEAMPEAAILVIDQAEPSDSLAGREDVPWQLFWHRRQGNQGPGTRIRLAAAMPFDFYLCIDDDVFLRPDQVAALASRLEEEPARAHGIWGQIVVEEAAGQGYLRDGVRRQNIEVAVLNQVYAFTRRRAQDALELANMMGYEDWANVWCTEDILLSCAGKLPPRIHDLGDFDRCPTARSAGIAVHMSEGFREERLALLSRLSKAGRLYVTRETLQLDGAGPKSP